jgi:hypothetical protein
MSQERSRLALSRLKNKGFRKEFRTFSCTSERTHLKWDQKHSLIKTHSLLGIGWA